ncbi:unnamed protein product [Bemisia tabaci]|uniref:T-cell immunomodulatory protein TIP C2 domain-containing protein n=1 Tax=Bemisia tabaci TaxID=7038 RepID=A0A9N9ZYV9_BEMTA|nr:unnamed protein product [Bemisia tabaci]
MKLKEIQYHALTSQISSKHCCSWSEDNSLAILTKNGILIVGFWRLFSLVCLISILHCIPSAEATDITNAVFGNHIPGLPAAFGDFNSDELTDLFTIRRYENGKGSSVEILLASDSEPLLRPDKKLVCSFENHVITSVVPGDFDHDVMMDVLVTAENTADSGDSHIYVYVHKGSLKAIDCADEAYPLIKMKSQPIAVDYNKDMVIDLFGEDEDGKRMFWVFPANFSKNESPPSYPLSNSTEEPFRKVHSNAFIDLNSDSDADLYITSQKHLEIWYRSYNGSFIKNTSENVANSNRVVGQTLFLDFQSTGELHQLVPICTKNSDGLGCKSSEIHIFLPANGTKMSSEPLTVNFVNQAKQKWSFSYDEHSKDHYLNAITLRAGDFNMDGFPDLLATLSPENDSSFKQTFLLENIECTTCGLFQRTFAVRWSALSASNNNTVLGVFYDFFQDGILDVIFVSQINNKVTAFRNNPDYDANFLKAMVISGVRQNFEALPTGPLGKKYRTYGTNLPGPTISYKTTTPEGQPQIASSAQLPQSAHYSLNLPYTIFGLGRSPNFIDSLTVHFLGSQRSWNQLIPNSQIIVIPYPLANPNSWRTQLFVTPSKIILQSVFALLGTCLLISAIIAVLYWKERKEDKREKLQQAHRFHFDAM